MLRVRIAKLAENIDLISKRISILGIKDIDKPPQGQVLRLQQMVRSAATNFIKEQLLNADPLPSEEEYEAFKEKRRKAIEARIEYERQMEIEELQRERRKEQQKRDGISNDGVNVARTDQVIYNFLIN